MKNKCRKQNKNVIVSRDGGSIAIRGFNFQYLYSCYILLTELSQDLPENKVRLEGVNDIDILHTNEYVQVKTSKNSIDSSKFWKMSILLNNLEVYAQNPNAKFKFVHNSVIAKGNVKGFESKKYSAEFIEYWQDKLGSYYEYCDVDLKIFFQKITFEKTDKISLIAKCKKILLEKFELNNNTEEQYLIALLYQIAQWSEKREVITYQDILTVRATCRFPKTTHNLS